MSGNKNRAILVFQSFLLVSSLFFGIHTINEAVGGGTLRHSTNKTVPTRRGSADKNSTAAHSSATNYTLPLGAEKNSQFFCAPGPYQPLSKSTFVLPSDLLNDEPVDLSDDVQYAVCDFHGRKDAHFPHAMQQLYRCFSFWLDYPDKQPVLMVPEKEVFEKLRTRTFVGGMFRIFGSNMNALVVNKAVFYGVDPTIQNMSQIAHVRAFNRDMDFGFKLEHVQDLHHFAEKDLQLSDDSRRTCHHKKPRIAILNRAKSKFRSMKNAELLSRIPEVKELSRNNVVEVKYFEDATFRDQVSFFRSVDIVISPHGAQLTGLAFMNAPCSRVHELFTKGYLIPHFFGSLATATTKGHSYMYFSANLYEGEKAQNKSERIAARRLDICPSISMMIDTIRELARDWGKCCASNELRVR